MRVAMLPLLLLAIGATATNQAADVPGKPDRGCANDVIDGSVFCDLFVDWREPNLSAKDALKGYRERYRLTVRPSIGPATPITIRVDRLSENRARMTATWPVNGRPHWESFDLQPKDLRRLDGQINPQLLALAGTTDPDCDDCVIVDSTDFLFEHVDQDGYKVLYRSGGDYEKAFLDLINAMIEAADFEEYGAGYRPMES